MTHYENNEFNLETVLFKLVRCRRDVLEKEFLCSSEAMHPGLVHPKCALYEMDGFRLYKCITSSNISMPKWYTENLVPVVGPHL